MYLGITQGSYGNDLGMMWEYLGDSGRVQDMTASVANGQQVLMYGPGKILLQQGFKGSEPIVLEEVWYTPHAACRLLSVNMLTSQGYKCVTTDQESNIWNASGTLVIWAIASPKNNLLYTGFNHDRLLQKIATIGLLITDHVIPLLKKILIIFGINALDAV